MEDVRCRENRVAGRSWKEDTRDTVEEGRSWRSNDLLLGRPSRDRAICFAFLEEGSRAEILRREPRLLPSLFDGRSRPVQNMAGRRILTVRAHVSPSGEKAWRYIRAIFGQRDTIDSLRSYVPNRAKRGRCKYGFDIARKSKKGVTRRGEKLAETKNERERNELKIYANAEYRRDRWRTTRKWIRDPLPDDGDSKVFQQERPRSPR